MNTVKRYWVAGLLVSVAFIIAVVLYGHLPDPVPTHWDLEGKANGWTAKPAGAFLGPIASLLLTALAVALPHLSPRGFEMTPFQRVYPTLVAAVAGLMLYLSIFALTAAIDVATATPARAMAGLGIFLMVVGNLFGKLTRNFFFGIRNPWTLASDHVWERTHRFAAPLFVFGGALLVVSAVSAASLTELLSILAVTSILPVLYSYLLWRRDERSAEPPRSVE